MNSPMPAPGACRVLLVDHHFHLFERAWPMFESRELTPSGPACNFNGALAAVERQRPDAVVVELSSAESFDTIEAIMAEHPTPILVLRPPHLPRSDAFEALALGALDVEECPDRAPDDFWRDLGKKVLLLAKVRVVRHLKGRRRSRAERNEPGSPVVAIASSLGGPQALAALLHSLPKGFRAPICICQHITEGFTEGLAHWLSTQTELEVGQARDGEPLRPGAVFIAPSGAHLLIQKGGRLKLDHAPPYMGFRPSCNLLLSSAAEAVGRWAIGVVLTGMGRDGANGLLDIRNQGGHTLAQDAASCAVYGMPREAVELEAAEEVLPLDQIGPALIRWVQAC